jgi:hypothetical protein
MPTRGKSAPRQKKKTRLRATRAVYPDARPPEEHQHLDRRRKHVYGQRGPRILMSARQGKISTSTEAEKTVMGNAGHVS